MATALQVVNKALVLLGQTPLGSLSQESRNARAAEAILDFTRQAFLSETYWKFALKEQALSEIPSDTSDLRTNYQYRYLLPSDVIRPIGDPVTYAPFQIAGGELYSDASQFTLLYVADKPVETFPPHVADAFAYRLAAELAVSVTEDDSRKQLAVAEANNAVSRAMGIDATIQSNWDLALNRILLTPTDTRF